jgi:hypothetical protein
MAAQLVRAVSDLDGRLARSFRELLTSPGALTEAHVAGRRRRFAGPFQLFLVANALFFAIQSFTQFNVFATPLHSHLANQDWSALARSLVEARLAEQGRTLASFAPDFDQGALLNAKALVIVMALMFLPFLPAVFPGTRRAFGAHFVFALHFYTFILLLLCLSLLLSEAQLAAGMRWQAADLTVSLFILASVGAYLYLAIGRFYGSRGVTRIAKASGLAVATAAIMIFYRFAIFLATLYTS